MLTSTIVLAIPNIILVLVTVWYAWSNHRFVKLTQKQLQIQTDPCVYVFTRKKQDTNMVDIVIRNGGRGIAKDIRFERPENVAEDIWQHFLHIESTPTPLSNTAIARGVSVLPPNEEIIIPWEPLGLRILPPENGLYILCKCKRLGSGPENEVEPIRCYIDALPTLKKE
jgi:hypothetical protein